MKLIRYFVKLSRYFMKLTHYNVIVSPILLSRMAAMRFRTEQIVYWQKTIKKKKEYS